MLLIGQAARQAGVGIGAMRLYERMGLIPPPRRTRSGYRQYPEDVVLRVRVIHRAKSLGFTLRQMADLFTQVGRTGMSGAEKDALLDAKLREVDAKIASLEHVRTLLSHLKRTSDGRPADSGAECALAKAAVGIVQALQQAGRPNSPTRRTAR